MNINQTLTIPLLALLVSGSAFSHGGFVLDSNGNVVMTSHGCLHTNAYTDGDANNCPLNKKSETAMVKPAPVMIKEPEAIEKVEMMPEPAPVVMSTPAEVPEPVLKKVINLDGVNFETGSDKLTGGSLNTLDSVAQELKANPNTKIVVEGHTDNRGDAAFNKSLSQARAEAVREHLIYQGVSASSISAKGYGEEKAIASNETTEGRAKNRRVELRILE